MKKTLIALFALALTTAGTASAQTKMAPVAPGQNPAMGQQHGQHKGHKSPAEKADHKASEMAKKLGLNADQENRVEQILLARQQEMQTLKSKYASAGNRQGMGAEGKAIRDKYDAQLKEVLGADLYAKYDQMRDEHHDKMKDMRGQQGGKPGKMKVKAKS